MTAGRSSTSQNATVFLAVPAELVSYTLNWDEPTSYRRSPGHSRFGCQPILSAYHAFARATSAVARLAWMGWSRSMGHLQFQGTVAPSASRWIHLERGYRRNWTPRDRLRQGGTDPA